MSSPGPMMTIRGFGEDSSVTRQMVKPGTWRRVLPYARPYRKWLLLSLLLIAVVPAIDTATIWMFKLVVDDVLVPRDFSAFVPIALAYVALTLLDGIASFFDEYLSEWVAGRFLLDLRTRFFAHLQGLSLDFFDRNRTGVLVSRMRRAVRRRQP